MLAETEDSLKPKRRWCSLNHGSWFVILGVLLIITAFLHGVIYFSIRTLTTSLDLVETVPNYATALLVCCTGILVLFLSKRRDLAFVIPTVILALVCVGLCASSAILTWLKVLAPMSRYNFCAYRQLEGQCRCYIIEESEITDYNQNSTVLWPGQDKEYVYKGSRSCHVIQYSLQDLVITQCVLYSTDFALCVAGLVLLSYFIRKNMVSVNACLSRDDAESEDELPLTLLESSSSTPDWCNNYFHRQMALPGLESSARNSHESIHPSGFPHVNPCCCHCECHSNCETSMGRLSYQRCRVTELPDHTTNETAREPDDRNRGQTANHVQVDNSGRNNCTDRVPLHSRNSALPGGTTGVNRNSSSCSSRNNENGISLLNYTRHQDVIPTINNQTEREQQNNQISRNTQTPIASRVHLPHSCHHNGRRCHHECRHSHSHSHSRRPRVSRSRRARTGMATMMPLSAWNLRRMQYPLPLEPPPPYRPWQLPPYLEDDPAPSYRSRATTPANSVYGALE